MASSSKIAISLACIAITLSGASLVWWMHRGKVREWKRQSDVARESRVRAERGDVKAEERLASLYYYGRGVPQDYGEALRWYQKAAEQGYAKAQFILGDIYYLGKAVPQDMPEAAHWYRKAAEQGDPKAQSSLGHAYYSGEGVPQDYSEASRWYRKAAEQGYALAQQGLGFMYAEGQGGQQDDTQAVAWYRKAAEQGDAVAQQSLGYMYAEGRGVPRDYREAIRWYRKAAEQGDVRAQRSLESLGGWSRSSIQYVELPTALLALSGALWFLWSSLRLLLRGKGLADRRPIAGLLGLDLLANSGLSFYAFAVDIRFSPYRIAFYMGRVLLVLAMSALYVLAKREKTSQLARTA